MLSRRRTFRLTAAILCFGLVACTTVQPPPGEPEPPAKTLRFDEAAGVAAAIVGAVLSFFSVTVAIR